LKEWWESKNNSQKKLKQELLLYHKNIMDFNEENLIPANVKPTEEGYYVVICYGGDGICQKTNYWKNGRWTKAINGKIIARSTNPIVLKSDIS
jgi:hypothetical protein